MLQRQATLAWLVYKPPTQCQPSARLLLFQPLTIHLELEESPSASNNFFSQFQERQANNTSISFLCSSTLLVSPHSSLLFPPQQTTPEAANATERDHDLQQGSCPGWSHWFALSSCCCRFCHPRLHQAYCYSPMERRRLHLLGCIRKKSPKTQAGDSSMAMR